MSETGSSEFMTRDRVAHLASLARIDLEPDEIDRFAGELSSILDCADTLQTLADREAPPMSHPVAVKNVMRDDEVHSSLSPDEVLAMAPATENQQFNVPNIMGDE